MDIHSFQTTTFLLNIFSIPTGNYIPLVDFWLGGQAHVPETAYTLRPLQSFNRNSNPFSVAMQGSCVADVSAISSVDTVI